MKDDLPENVKDYIKHQIENDELNRWFANLPYNEKLRIKNESPPKAPSEPKR